MKKNLLTLLVAASVMTMVACGGSDAANNNAANNDVANTEVVATGYVIYSSIWDKVQMTFNEDGTTLKLDYTAAANEQLVGQFYIAE